jgi:hypothetical protein
MNVVRSCGFNMSQDKNELFVTALKLFKALSEY